MRKGLIFFGFSLFIVGVVVGFYASQRNCLIVFLTTGYMSFWTAIEIVGGFIVLAGLIIALIGFIKKRNEEFSLHYPFTTAIGMSLATRVAIPTLSLTSATLSTSL